MSTTTATPTNRIQPEPAIESRAPRTRRQRAGAVISSVFAGVLGVAPHVLHHAGPLAGAALLAGTAGTLLFGAIGLVAAIPFLVRVHRRCGNWRMPAALLALFAAIFSISAFVIGPAIAGSENGSGKPATTQSTPGAPAGDGHASHHK